VFDLSALNKCLDTAKALHAGNMQTRQELQGAIYNLDEMIGSKPAPSALCSAVLDAVELYSEALWEKEQYDVYEAEVAEAAGVKAREIEDRSQVYDKLHMELVSKSSLESSTVSQIRTAEGARYQTKAKIAQADQQIAAYKTKGRNRLLATVQGEIESCRATLLDLQLKKSNLESSVVTIQSMVCDAKQHEGKECPTCHQRVATDFVSNISKIADERVEERVAEASQLGCQITDGKLRLADLEVELKKITEDEQKKAFRKSIEANKKVLEDDAAELEQSIRTLRITLSEQQADKREVATKIAEFGDALKDRDVAIARNQAFAYVPRPVDSIHDRVAKLSELESELKHVEGLIQARKDKAEDLDAIAVDSAVSGHLVEAFGKNGIQAILIENLVGTIEQFTNDTLDRMNSKFTIQLSTQKLTTGGDVRETLDIIVSSGADVCMLEDCSGGEQTIINLALRFALSRVVSSLHGVKMDSIFLDEVLAELDEHNREAVIQVVTYLAKTFSQVFIISHTGQVKDVLPSGLIVQRYDNYSKVNIVDTQTEGQRATA
jgi:DNA repair exonuclease SbcCD ATPase subunit